MKKIFLLLSITFCAFYTFEAQCTGVVGTPVRNYDFGAGSLATIGDATANEASSSLVYAGTTCPSDGTYIIGNSTDGSAGCYLSAWVTAPDHTGNAGGRMIIANLGLSSTNIFSFDLSNVLCPGQAYNFSAWYSSIVKANIFCGAAESSGLTFRIIEINASGNPTGNTIFSTNTPLFGPLSNSATTLDWKKANNTFIVPTGGTGRYRFIIDSQFRSNICGNDVAIDDIVLQPIAPCVSIAQSPANPVACGSPFTLTATVDPIADIDPVTAGNQPYTYTNPAYQWQKSTDGGAMWNNILGATSATYSVASASPSVDAAQYRVLVSNAAIACNMIITSPVQTVAIDGSCPTGCTPTFSELNGFSYLTGGQVLPSIVSLPSVPLGTPLYGKGAYFVASNVFTVGTTSYDAVLFVEDAYNPSSNLPATTPPNTGGIFCLGGAIGIIGSGAPDPYFIYRVYFVVSGSATVGNPSGNAVSLNNVGVRIGDIDGISGVHFTEISGAFTNPSSVGSSLAPGGFDPNAYSSFPALPTNSSYSPYIMYRGSAFVDGNTGTSVPSVSPTNLNYAVTYNYPFYPSTGNHYLFGLTGSSTGNNNRGINFNFGICGNQVCFKPATTGAGALETKHGITSLGRAGAGNGNWPMVRNGAWTALESKTKGFVINRLTDAQVAALPAAQLKVGMTVYNTTQNCMQINTDGTSAGWKCFNTQTCPIVN